MQEGKRLSFHTIAQFFNVPNAASVEFQWHQYQKKDISIGRPTVFSSQLIDEIQKRVIFRFKHKNPVTILELVDYVQYHYHRSVTDDTMRHFISRISRFHTVIGVPMEAKRVASSDDDIIRLYQEFSQILKTIPARFIFNMDETGCSEFVDKCELMVVFPDSYSLPNIAIPVDRHTKRSTLTCCISADGQSLKPYVIIDRVSLDDQIILSGYGPLTAEFVTQKHGFVTMLLFDKWANDIFSQHCEQNGKIP
jgi:hypothetical protein